MPKLKQINCAIELGMSNTNLKEYGTRYGDGQVECFIAAPDLDIPFCIHITSKGYIAPGLAFFVFMDGEYQCNRNRVGLKLPLHGVKSTEYETEFRLRQKEDKTAESTFIVREWTFAKLNRVAANKASRITQKFLQNVGTIEVIALRCRAAVDIIDQDKGASQDQRRPSSPKVSHLGQQKRKTKLSPKGKPPSRAPSAAAQSKAGSAFLGFGDLGGFFDGPSDIGHADLHKIEDSVANDGDVCPRAPPDMFWNPTHGRFEIMRNTSALTHQCRARDMVAQSPTDMLKHNRLTREDLTAQFDGPYGKSESAILGRGGDDFMTRLLSAQEGISPYDESPVGLKQWSNDIDTFQRQITEVERTKPFHPDLNPLKEHLADFRRRHEQISDILEDWRVPEFYKLAKQLQEGERDHEILQEALCRIEDLQIDVPLDEWFERIRTARKRARKDESIVCDSQTEDIPDASILCGQLRARAELLKIVYSFCSRHLPERDLALVQKRVSNVCKQEQEMRNRLEKLKQKGSAAHRGGESFLHHPSTLLERMSRLRRDLCGSAVDGPRDCRHPTPRTGFDKTRRSFSDDPGWQLVGEGTAQPSRWQQAPRPEHQSRGAEKRRRDPTPEHFHGSDLRAVDEWKMRNSKDLRGQPALSARGGLQAVYEDRKTDPVDKQDSRHSRNTGNDDIGNYTKNWSDKADKPASDHAQATSWNDRRMTNGRVGQDNRNDIANALTAGNKWDDGAAQPSRSNKGSRPRSVIDQNDPPHTIKPYWKEWNKRVVHDEDTVSRNCNKRGEPRGVFRYPAEPLPAIPEDQAKDASHAIRASRGADYAHKCRKPVYIDTMEAPYAVFTFKYCSRDRLHELLKIPVENIERDLRAVETQAERAQLLGLPKHKLVEKLMEKMDKTNPVPNETSGWAMPEGARKAEVSGSIKRGEGSNAGNAQAGSWQPDAPNGACTGPNQNDIEW